MTRRAVGFLAGAANVPGLVRLATAAAQRQSYQVKETPKPLTAAEVAELHAGADSVERFSELFNRLLLFLGRV